jgi:vanillate O-demethylase monooxygenase subunit
MVRYVRNAWYPLAYAKEVGTEPLCRTLFGRDLVAFRDADGVAAVLDDRCPHKSAPLSMGTVTDGVIACPYHGMEFDRSGACRRIPGQATIPPKARVTAYAVLERFGLVWIWPGDPAKADPALLPALPLSEVPGWTTFHGPRLVFESHIANIVENLVDPAHTSFVHQKTIGGRDAGDVPLTTQENGRAIVTGRWIENSAPVPVMVRYGGFSGPVDRWQHYHLFAPNVSMVDMGAVEAGGARDEAARNARYRTISCAALSPETETTTHYFWWVTRNFAPGDAAVSAEMTEAYVATFDEDRELLARVQRLMAQDAAPPLRLAIDEATIRLRRLIGAMLEAEAA